MTIRPGFIFVDLYVIRLAKRFFDRIKPDFEKHINIKRIDHLMTLIRPLKSLRIGAPREKFSGVRLIWRLKQLLRYEYRKSD